MPQQAVRADRGAPAPAVRNYPLTLTRATRAIVLPATDHAQRSFVGGCAYSGQGVLIDASRRLGGSDSAQIIEPVLTLEKEPPELSGDHVFGGLMFGAFGHFLLESTSRLWPFLGDDADRPRRVAFAAYGSIVARQLEEAPADGYIRILLGAAGLSLGDVTVAVAAPLRFEHLIVPQSTVAIQSHVHPAFPRFYEHALNHYGLADPAPGAARRIYLSRSRLSVKRRRAANEADIERLAAAAGFDIVHPQRLPFLEQMALVRGADVIAGCDGSALHLAVFARRGTTILNLDTRRSMTQHTIEAAMELCGRRIPIKLADAPGAKPRLKKEWMADLDRVSQAFATL